MVDRQFPVYSYPTAGGTLIACCIYKYILQKQWAAWQFFTKQANQWLARLHCQVISNIWHVGLSDLRMTQIEMFSPSCSITFYPCSHSIPIPTCCGLCKKELQIDELSEWQIKCMRRSDCSYVTSMYARCINIQNSYYILLNTHIIIIYTEY